MNRRGQTNRSPLAVLVGLVVLVGGAVALYRFTQSSDDKPAPPAPANAGPGAGPHAGPNPPAPTPVADDGPAVAPAKKVEAGETVQVPFIFWGGDVATFVANGGLKTTKDSILGRQDLTVQLTPGDDFDKQVQDYLDNKSPFLRGTLSMLGQASDKLNAKPETTPVVFLQLTWSAGDHLVGRAGFKSLNDLKGKKIALQKGGPHVGMLNDCLRTARLDWKDVTIVWTDEVSGDKGPAAAFRKDPTIDACFAISPEMSDLTGGLERTGDGGKNTMPGAHVILSTAWMSHSIADVYACRRDFWEGNKEWVQKFAAGYIKGCEEMTDAKASGAAPYKAAIQLARDIWGKDPAFKDAVANPDDVDGLISDATFAGLPGNIAFFTSKGNLAGFPFKRAQAQTLPEDPATQPLRVDAKPFRQADLDYEALRKTGTLTGKEIEHKFVEIKNFEELKEQTIYSFTISFEADDPTFPEETYGDDFQRALEAASLFGNAVIAIKGHATPVGLIEMFENAGVDSGLLTYDADTETYTWKDGKKLDLSNIHTLLDAIAKNPGLRYSFKDDDGQLHTGLVSEAEQDLQKLSDDRAAGVRQAIINYAQKRGLVLEDSQMQSKGFGVTDPIIPNPTTEEQSAKNRRVEFSIVKVPLGL